MPTSAFFGVKVSTIMWGAVGGITSSIFGPSSWTYRMFMVFTGTVTATVFGPLWVTLLHQYLSRFLELYPEDIEPPVIFLSGLTGMWLCGLAIEVSRHLKRRVVEGLDRRFQRWFD